MSMSCACTCHHVQSHHVLAMQVSHTKPTRGSRLKWCETSSSLRECGVCVCVCVCVGEPPSDKCRNELKSSQVRWHRRAQRSKLPPAKTNVLSSALRIATCQQREIPLALAGWLDRLPFLPLAIVGQRLPRHPKKCTSEILVGAKH